MGSMHARLGLDRHVVSLAGAEIVQDTVKTRQRCRDADCFAARACSDDGPFLEFDTGASQKYPYETNCNYKGRTTCPLTLVVYSDISAS